MYLFCTHAVGTIRRADVIFVIKDCELVEQGTHEDLLARNGVYAEMHRTQNPENGQFAAVPRRGNSTVESGGS